MADNLRSPKAISTDPTYEAMYHPQQQRGKDNMQLAFDNVAYLFHFLLPRFQIFKWPSTAK